RNLRPDTRCRATAPPGAGPEAPTRLPTSGGPVGATPVPPTAGVRPARLRPQATVPVVACSHAPYLPRGTKQRAAGQRLYMVSLRCQRIAHRSHRCAPECYGGGARWQGGPGPPAGQISDNAPHLAFRAPRSETETGRTGRTGQRPGGQPAEVR